MKNDKNAQVERKCHHENDAENPAMVREFTYSDGVQMYAVRQCSICNETVSHSRPLPKDFAKTLQMDAFYDFEAGSWEPLSKHAAYEDAKQAKLKTKE